MITSDLSEILDRVAFIDGRVRLLPLDENAIAGLSGMVVWAYQDRRSIAAVVRFGDTEFRPQHVNKAVVIDSGSVLFDFEIKSIMLALLHLGLQEGGTSYKWNSVSQRVRTLNRFAGYLLKRGVRSFRDFETMELLRLRTLMLGFMLAGEDHGGLSAQECSSGYKTFRDALKHVADYGLVTRSDYRSLLDDLTLGSIDKHEAEARLRHPIIPTGVMKSLIAEADAYIKEAGARFQELEALMRLTNSAIPGSPVKKVRMVIPSRQREAHARLSKLIKRYFKDLPRHVYMLVLSFTGMRDNEAFALETSSAGKRKENGELLFFVKSILSKTDDNTIELDWVANELTYDAISLLSKINELFYERARLFIEHLSDRLTPEHHHELKLGLSDRRLFGIRMTASTTAFVWTGTGSDDNVMLSLRKYRIPVTRADISQLERMECNYQSVSANSGSRGVPYDEGICFNLSPHQFRHTFAWFIIANRLGDIDDIKYQFKHLNRAMTLVYGERGYKSLSELKECIEFFETFVNQKSIDDIVQASVEGHVAGGGGERLVKLLKGLNGGQDETVYGAEHQAHFQSAKDVVAFATRHSESIRGLPHGYCTKGPSCKIKNAADPSHCLYCDTYFATPKHLPYWKTIKANCETKLERIAAMADASQNQFAAFKQVLEDNLFAANKIIGRLVPPTQDSQRAS